MRLRLPALAGLAFAALLLAPAAQAAHDPDWQGWFFQLDGALVTPGNTDTATYMRGPNVPIGFNGAESEVEWVDWDDDIALRGSIGYSFGSAGAIRVSYWTYDDTQENSGADYDIYGAAWFTVGPVTNVAFSYYAPSQTTWDFEQTIEATTWDIEYGKVREVGNTLNLMFGVGVRIAEFKDTLDGQYVLPDLDPNDIFVASRTIDGDGIGITGSIGASYEFSDLFGISSNLRVGFLTADVDMEHSLFDKGDYAGLGYYPTFSESETIEDKVAMTMDFDINFTFHTGGFFDIEVGYMYSQWSGLPEFNLTRTFVPIGDPVFAVPPEIAGEERDHMAWGGPQLRLRLHL
jgi:hypothetical protein